MSALEPASWSVCSDLVWGANGPSQDTLVRWLQGFQFCEGEPTALVQLHGGPCSVVTAIQAQIIRLLLFEHGCRRPQDFTGEATSLLTEALACVMRLLATASGRGSCQLVFPASDRQDEAAEGIASLEEIRQRLLATEVAVAPNADDFLGPMVMSILPALCGPLGFLSVVYSAVLTLGAEKVRQQVADDGETLIDPRSGNGSQALLNLLVTGMASSHLFDGARDLDGLHMQGIVEQPSVGFLTLLEALRYCEVGWHLKNPRYPVWIVGSETHLTVVFSDEAGLIQTDGRYHQVERAFQRLDTSGSGFLSADKLEDLMAAAKLDLPPDCPKLADLQAKLDPEGLQILIRDNFLKFFFPDDEPAYPTRFAIHHLNNLAKGANARVAYVRGQACIGSLDARDSQLFGPVTAEEAQSPEGGVSGHCDLLRVLHTKWPTLRVTWEGDKLPSVY